VCSFCGETWDRHWLLACPTCGGKYVTPSQRWQPAQLRLWLVCPGCGNRREDPTQLCLHCRMGLAS
jgi:hypothetical protein